MIVRSATGGTRPEWVLRSIGVLELLEPMQPAEASVITSAAEARRRILLRRSSQTFGFVDVAPSSIGAPLVVTMPHLPGQRLPILATPALGCSNVPLGRDYPVALSLGIRDADLSCAVHDELPHNEVYLMATKFVAFELRAHIAHPPTAHCQREVRWPEYRERNRLGCEALGFRRNTASSRYL